MWIVKCRIQEFCTPKWHHNSGLHNSVLVLISCSIGNRPKSSYSSMNTDHSVVWLLRVLAGDASKHLSPSSHQLLQEWSREGLRGRPLEAEGKDPQIDSNSPRPIETFKSAEMFWLGYAVLKGKRMVKKLLVNLHVYSMCVLHGVFKHVSLLGVNHWKPVKHLWNTDLVTPEAVLRQARWMRMRPSRRRHGSYWRPWRTVRIWDPSRWMEFFVVRKPRFLTYETRGVTERLKALKE